MGKLVKAQNISQFRNGEGKRRNRADRMGWVVVSAVDRPCHHPLRVDPEVQQVQADQQDPGHRHDQLDLEALSHPRGTKNIC